MRIVIAGGGLAAGSAAVALIEQGFSGEVIVLGEEPLAPYDRPPLSKAVLRNEQHADLSFKDLAYWDEHNVELRLGHRAVSLDARARMISTQDETLGFDKLLIATGGRARRLNVPGFDLEGVCVLRTLADAHAIRDAAASARSAVVVGMGFIGAEVAASLHARGLRVTAIEPFSAPLERVLGVEIGSTIARLHAGHGVRLLLQEGVTAFEGGSFVERVITSSGNRIDCDLCVVGVGMQPNTEWLDGSGVAVDNGVLVDAACESNIEGIFAAGDVANHDHPLFGRLRIEHWQNAINQGACAARNMMSETKEPYSDVHWFWSDQFDVSLQYAGHASSDARMVVRGLLDDPPYLAFFVRNEILEAVFGFNNGRDVRRAMKLIGKPVQAEMLRDPSVDLRTLA